MTLFVPPAYHVGFGARMNMGKIAAIRNDSPASNAGLAIGPTAGDVITGVQVIFPGKPPVTLLSEEKQLDPVRLPYELETTVRRSGVPPADVKVVLTVRGPAPEGHEANKKRTLEPLALGRLLLGGRRDGPQPRLADVDPATRHRLLGR